MKIDVYKVLIDILRIDPYQVKQYVDGGMVKFSPDGRSESGKSLVDTSKTINVVPGSKLYIPGLTYIYFAPAINSDLEIYGVRSKNGMKTQEKMTIIPSGLTLENHAEKMGTRFKMTKSEKIKFGHLPKKEGRLSAFKERYNK